MTFEPRSGKFSWAELEGTGPPVRNEGDGYDPAIEHAN